MANYLPTQAEMDQGAKEQRTRRMDDTKAPDMTKKLRKNRVTRMTNGSKNTIKALSPENYAPERRRQEKGERKAIIVMCPVCENPHILEGDARFDYLKRLERKEIKFGKTCSKECAKKLAAPAFRKYHAKEVADKYKEIDLRKKQDKKKRKQYTFTSLEATESKISKMQKMLAEVD